MYNDFLLINPFANSFVSSDWPELVIYFQTNEEVLRQVCATFGIETFQEEHQKAINMFLEGNDDSVSLPTGYGKSLIY